jgi:hypothetical protein
MSEEPARGEGSSPARAGEAARAKRLAALFQTCPSRQPGRAAGS